MSVGGRERSRGGLIVLWAAVPVISLGLLAWCPFLYFAARARTRLFWGLTALYLTLAVVAAALLAVAGEGRAHQGLQVGGGLLLMGLMAGGAVNVLAIRRPYAEALRGAQDPDLLTAERHVEQRRRALQICRADPERAKLLGIGRPDVPGAFDAGLVDVNHAGVEVLAALPGLDRAAAERIVALRDPEGFSSLNDLDVVLDLPEGALEDLRERLIFLPRG